jgi:hypothetical protein
MTATSLSPTQWIGSALTRVAVPLWILTGAVFKLVERTPSNLPSRIVKTAKDLNLDLGLVLRSLIGLELLAVAVMLFMPRYARPVAIFILACFCGILLNEIRAGATSCGCFGTVTINPWVMLSIDGALLLLIAVFPPRAIPASAPSAMPASAWQRNWPIAAVVAIILGFGIAFGLPEKAAIKQEPVAVEDEPQDVLAATASTAPISPATGPRAITTPTGPIAAPGDGQGTTPQAAASVTKQDENPKSPTAPTDPTRNPNPLPLKAWYSPEPDKWVNKPWRDVDLFQFMPRWPAGLDKGRHYVLFYSKTCEHCHDLLEFHFNGIPPIPTVLIEIPTAKPGEGAPLPMPTTRAQFLALPEADWLITTPLMLAIEDGKVICAKEGADVDEPECLMGWMQ